MALSAARKSQFFLSPSVQKARFFYTASAQCQNAALASVPTSAGVAKAEADGGTVKVSKAMRAYMERARVQDNFIKQQLQEYNIGKRHLANMMGRDPEFFSQEDVDEAIRYLFPSGLFDPRARPLMKHPSEIYPKRKAAEFDIHGRPFHSLFYTSKPNYFKMLQDAAQKFKQLDWHEDRVRQRGRGNVEVKANESFLSGSDWQSKGKIEGIFLETLSDKQYATLIKTLERLSQHAYASLEKDFLMQFRRPLAALTELQDIPPLLRDESGRSHIAFDARRKWAKASVKVIGQGTGLIEINGQDIHYFERRQDKEQIIFPLEFCDMLGKVDVVATVSGGGLSGQAGAIRHGLSLCLRSFVDSQMVERMRLAGLLSFDPRTRERKKPGQEGARRKFTWKKR